MDEVNQKIIALLSEQFPDEDAFSIFLELMLTVDPTGQLSGEDLGQRIMGHLDGTATDDGVSRVLRRFEPRMTAAQEREQQRLQLMTAFIEDLQGAGRISPNPSDAELQSVMRAFDQIEQRAGRQVAAGERFEEAFLNEVFGVLDQGVREFLTAIPGTVEYQQEQEGFQRQQQEVLQREQQAAQEEAQRQQEMALQQAMRRPPTTIPGATVQDGPLSQDAAFAAFLEGIMGKEDPETVRLAQQEGPGLRQRFDAGQAAERERVAARRQDVMAFGVTPEGQAEHARIIQQASDRNVAPGPLFSTPTQGPADFTAFLQRELDPLRQRALALRGPRPQVTRTTFR